MLDLHRAPPETDTKAYFTHALLPSYIDPLHPPTKKTPFNTFRSQPHSHTLDLILPAATWSTLRSQHPFSYPLVYARVNLSLLDILDSAFLDAYARSPGAHMRSEAKGDVDTNFTLTDGVLRIGMKRSVYERAGLQGVRDESARGAWRVEFDLKQDSMKSGKRGFERLVWAAREALSGTMTWLVWRGDANFTTALDEGRDALSTHHPEIIRFTPAVQPLSATLVPTLDPHALRDQESALPLLEWLDMLSLSSPRVKAGGEIDTHLCRYEVPDFNLGVETHDLVRVRWHGFITPSFAQDVFLATWAGSKGKRDKHPRVEGEVGMDTKPEWFAMSACAFGAEHAWSLMQFANRETLVWSVEG